MCNIIFADFVLKMVYEWMNMNIKDEYCTSTAHDNDIDYDDDDNITIEAHVLLLLFGPD